MFLAMNFTVPPNGSRSQAESVIGGVERSASTLEAVVAHKAIRKGERAIKR